MAANTVFEAKTREAQCFFTSAELTADACVALKKGENEVLLSGISPFLTENSVRIRIGGPAVLSSFEFVRNLSLEEEAEKDALKEELHLLERQLEALEALDQIGSETARILTEALPNRLSTGENPTEEELMKSIAFYQEKQTSLLMERQQREKEKALLSRKIREKDEVLKRGGAFGNYLKLSITASEEGDFPVEVTYNTSQVSWTPFYTITVKNEKEPVEIALKARLKQTTGIDWQNVLLSFSTGMPNAGGRAPELSPWTLYALPTLTMDSRRKSAMPFGGMMVSESAGAYVEEESAAPMMAEMANSSMLMAQHMTVQEDALSVTYAIDLRYSVSGAGKEQNVDLRVFSAPARFYYYAVPKLSEDVFYMAELQESEKLDLPRGTASVHYNGTYLGETEIDGGVTLEKLTLTLGKDRRISVKREQEKDYKEKKLFGTQTEQEFCYAITAKNNKTEDVTLRIDDQYPKSSDKEITIRLSDKMTTPKENDEKKGFLTWESVLPAGQQEKIEFAYTVTYPKEKRINL